MNEHKRYQVKDVMEHFGITRDTLKYYEKRGLIKAERKENGYRVYDEINVQKLKKILAFRDMGMTIDEIIQHVNSTSHQERMEVMAKVRQRVEDEVCNLNKTLCKIREFEHNASTNPFFSCGFNVGYDLTLCVDCSHITAINYRSFSLKSSLKILLDTNGKVKEIGECNLVINEDLGIKTCIDCPLRQRIKQYYRYRIPYVNMKELISVLEQEILDLKLQQMEPIDEIYIVKKTLQENGKDILILDTYIPVTKK